MHFNSDCMRLDETALFALKVQSSDRPFSVKVLATEFARRIIGKAASSFLKAEMAESKEQTDKRQGILKAMEHFPCLFNIPGFGMKPNRQKLEFLESKLREEAQQGREDFEGEKMMLLDALCWIYFYLGDVQKAMEVNDQSKDLAKENLVALGNRIFLEIYSRPGQSQVLMLVDQIEGLRANAYFEDIKLSAIAGQAYFLYRIGPVYNMSLSAKLYRKLTQRRPDNLQWMYFLGVLCFRIDHIVNDIGFKKSEEIFRDIAENRMVSVYLKSLAWSFLACIKAEDEKPSSEEVEECVKNATKFGKNNSTVFYNCGLAQNKIGKYEQALDCFKTSVSLKPDFWNLFSVGKNYVYGNIKNLEEAIRNLEESNRLAMGTDLICASNLAFAYKEMIMTEASDSLFTELTMQWSIPHHPFRPYDMARCFNFCFCRLQNDTVHEDSQVQKIRYASIAISNYLERAKRCLKPSKKCTLLDDILSSNRLLGGDYVYMKHLFALFRESLLSDTIPYKLARRGKLQREKLTPQIKKSLEAGKSYEALVMLEIADLDEANSSLVPKELRYRVFWEEAEWQLGQGLISCRLLFQRMFDLCHGRHKRVGTPDIGDVLILHDSPQWSRFGQYDADHFMTSTSGGRAACQLYQEILECVFGLDVFSNPWLPLVTEIEPDVTENTDETLPGTNESCNHWSKKNVLTALVDKYQLKRVLVLSDHGTTESFLRTIDSLLGPVIQGATATGSATPSATTTATVEVSILCHDGDGGGDVINSLPHLAGVSRFDARHNGIPQTRVKGRNNLKGTEILDAYFSGNVQNALTFFTFLAHI